MVPAELVSNTLSKQIPVCTVPYRLLLEHSRSGSAPLLALEHARERGKAIILTKLQHEGFEHVGYDSSLNHTAPAIIVQTERGIRHIHGSALRIALVHRTPPANTSSTCLIIGRSPDYMQNTWRYDRIVDQVRITRRNLTHVHNCSW